VKKQNAGEGFVHCVSTVDRLSIGEEALSSLLFCVPALKNTVIAQTPHLVVYLRVAVKAQQVALFDL